MNLLSLDTNEKEKLIHVHQLALSRHMQKREMGSYPLACSPSTQEKERNEFLLGIDNGSVLGLAVLVCQFGQTKLVKPKSVWGVPNLDQIAF